MEENEVNTEDTLPIEDYPSEMDDDFGVFMEMEKIKEQQNNNNHNNVAPNYSTMTRNQIRNYRKSRKIRKKEKKQRTRNILARFKDMYLRGTPVIMAEPYKQSVEDGLVRFFRRGYEKYWNDGQPADSEEIIDFLRKDIIRRYKLIISGGFVLKNMGLTNESRTKPSIDVDIFIPSDTPLKHPEFYETMAKLFDADRIGDKWVVTAFTTDKSRGLNQMRERGVYGVHSYMRDTHLNEDHIAKMDLVRPYQGISPLRLVREFDMSICANWYDGNHLYSMDPGAIFKKKAGYCNPAYNFMLFNPRYQRYRNRILKYLLRGYRLQYFDETTGKFIEFKTSDFPNAIERMNFPQREMYYREHPNERPKNQLSMNRTRKNNSSL